MQSQVNPLETFLVPCIVKNDWVASLKALNLSYLKAVDDSELFGPSFLAFQSLLYKSNHQKRGSKLYSQLKKAVSMQVQACLRTMKRLHISTLTTKFAEIFEGFLTLHDDSQRFLVPSQGGAVWVLNNIVKYCRCIDAMAATIHQATIMLQAEIAHSFFMPINTSMLAVLSYIKAVSVPLLLGCVHAYNNVVDIVHVLPPEDKFLESAFALPLMLQCTWNLNIPTLVHVGDLLLEQGTSKVKGLLQVLALDNTHTAAHTWAYDILDVSKDHDLSEVLPTQNQVKYAKPKSLQPATKKWKTQQKPKIPAPIFERKSDNWQAWLE